MQLIGEFHGYRFVLSDKLLGKYFEANEKTSGFYDKILKNFFQTTITTK